MMNGKKKKKTGAQKANDRVFLSKTNQVVEDEFQLSRSKFDLTDLITDETILNKQIKNGKTKVSSISVEPTTAGKN